MHGHVTCWGKALANPPLDEIQIDEGHWNGYKKREDLVGR